MIRIGRETIAITTDTVGTKVLLAEKMGRWEEVSREIRERMTRGADPTRESSQ